MFPKSTLRIFKTDSYISWLPILAIAALFLLPLLEIKPVHHDEAVNGWFVTKMWEQGFFRYDPQNYHGPLFFYLLQLSEIVFGRGIFSLRLVAALFSMGAIFLVLKHGKWFGQAAVWAGLLLALSPAVSFYSRYAIHESGFVFFQILFSYGFFRHRFSGGSKSVALMMAGAVGMLLMKETWIIFAATWAIAWGMATAYGRYFGETGESHAESEGHREEIHFGQALGIVLTGLGILFLFYSGFLLNPNGITDFFKSLAFWTETGVGATGHEKPFYYWLKLLFRYETIIPLVLAVSFGFAAKTSRSCRFWAAFAFGIFLAYSLVPYKTPWCIFNIIWPFGMVFGFLMDRLVSVALEKKHAKAGRAMLFVLVAALMAKSGYMSVMLNFFNYENSDEPYNYVQSRNDLNQAMRYIETAAGKNAGSKNLSLNVFLSGTWPFPWLLTDYTNNKWRFTENADADVVLIEINDREKTENCLKNSYHVWEFQIRAARDPVLGYFSVDKFDGIVTESDRIFEGEH